MVLIKTNGSAQLKLGGTPSAINKSSILELESKVQGLLLTRVPDTLVSPLTSAPDGTIIFFTKDNTLRIRKNGLWQQVADPTNFWKLNNIAGGDLTGTYPDPSVAPSAITNTKLADNSVSTAKIIDGNVTTNKLADQSVTSLKLADNSVITSKILDGNVTTTKLDDQSVTSLKLADNSVITSKILDGNVTYGKIQNVTANKLLGRYASTAGSMQEITLGTGLALDNTTGTLQVQNNLSNLQDVAISSPASGHILLYNGTKWANTSLNSLSSTVWALGGNAVGSEQKLGTTSNFDVPVITNNQEKMRVTTTGNVGIATSAPGAKLDVAGDFKLGQTGTVLTGIMRLSLGSQTIPNIGSLVTKTVTIVNANIQANASVVANVRGGLPDGLVLASSYATAGSAIIKITNVTGAALGPYNNLTFDITIIQ